MSEAPFFGRVSALEQLGDRLARAARSEPQIVLVDGPAGIGKTSLVRRFLASAHPGCHVLRASGEEMEMHLPYGVAAQLLAHARKVVDVPEEELERTTRPDGPVPDPIAVGSCLLDTLDRIQDQATGILVIDDIHWADTPPCTRSRSCCGVCGSTGS